MTAACIFLGLIAVATRWSLWMLSYVGKATGGHKGYSEVVEFYYNVRGGGATDCFIAFLNFGTSIAYLDVLADIFCGWMGPSARVGSLFSVLVFILFPLCSIRTFDQLSFTSVMGTSIYGIFGIVVLLIYASGVRSPGENVQPNEMGFTTDFASIIPILTLAFACNTVLLPVYNEFMESPGAETEDFNSAVTLAISFTFGLYMLIGIFGSLTFQDATAGDILLNYSVDKGGLTFCLQAVFAISLCFTYPLVIYPLRDSFDKLLMRIPAFESMVFRYRPDNKSLHQRWYIETILLMLTGFLFAVILPSLEVIFGLTGSIAGTTLCFIVPSSMFLKATQSKGSSDGDSLATWRLRAKLLLYTSIPLGLMGFLLTILNLSTEDSDDLKLCQKDA